jgi:hypothetical protein
LLAGSVDEELGAGVFSPAQAEKVNADPKMSPIDHNDEIGRLIFINYIYEVKIEFFKTRF